MATSIHMLCGVPRSGSTLIGNVLEQHPDVYVSGTSSLASCVQAVSVALSNSDAVPSELVAMPESYERFRAAMRGLVDGWYADRDGVVVDKGRGWATMRALVDEVVPGARFVCCVRDPRDVIASVEAQHRATALFTNPVGDQTLITAAEMYMTRDAMVGGPMWHIEDMIRRQHTADVLFVPYEAFTASPRRWMDDIATHLGIDGHDWDLVDVASRARDADGVWRGKFPHDGSGAVAPSPRSWRDVMDPGLADQIVSVYPLFASTFGYRSGA